MNFETIILIIVGIILVVGAICYVINQKKSIKEWLFFAVTEAEKLLGSKTGELKLRQVFSGFISLYPFLAKFIRFETFSKWVDKAIVEMKEYLKSNKEAKEYVGISDESLK